MMKKYSTLIGKLAAYAVIPLFLISCGDDSGEVKKATVAARLENSEFIATTNASSIATLIAASGTIDIPVEKLQYDVTTYKVEYITGYKDSVITASGLVILPDIPEPFAIASFQHGTIASNAEAPTELPSSDLQLTLYRGLASLGVITVVPDFIGFGSSSEIMHPYYVEDPSADAVIDNLRAAVELAEENDITVPSNLYLAGYSQGGYVTMAAHKAFEEEDIEFFELQASYPASGGYHIEGVRNFFFEQETYHQPFFLAYVAEAYRTYYEEDEQFLGTLFQPQYAEIIPDLFDGSLSGDEINNQLTTTIADLVAPDYLADPGGSQYFFINGKFQDNSLVNWIPEIEMNMYHGDEDITVPYQNSIDVYQTFIENGASSDKVTFTTIPGGTHGTSIGPYAEFLLKDILEKEGI